MVENSIEQAIGKIASRTKQNTERVVQQNRQRRNLVTDDFDKEYTAIGQEGQSGVIWLAISPDMIYIERWEFKVIIDPFLIPISGGTGAMSAVSLHVSDTNLSSSGSSISPNPHNHVITPNPHTHTINAGVTSIPSQVENIRIHLDGYDLTAHFKAQFNGWIDSEGMFPDSSMENRYDILKAISLFPEAQRSAFLTQGYHKLEFISDGLFNLKIREFKKYNFINRHGDSTAHTNEVEEGEE